MQFRTINRSGKHSWNERFFEQWASNAYDHDGVENVNPIQLILLMKAANIEIVMPWPLKMLVRYILCPFGKLLGYQEIYQEYIYIWVQQSMLTSNFIFIAFTSISCPYCVILVLSWNPVECIPFFHKVILYAAVVSLMIDLRRSVVTSTCLSLCLDVLVFSSEWLIEYSALLCEESILCLTSWLRTSFSVECNYSDWQTKAHDKWISVLMLNIIESPDCSYECYIKYLPRLSTTAFGYCTLRICSNEVVLLILCIQIEWTVTWAPFDSGQFCQECVLWM